MAAKRSKYDNYDNENKGKLWKVFKPLLIALAIVFGICLVSLALSDFGLFPGNLLNRFSAASYIEETYGGEIISYDRYDKSSGNYIYKGNVAGKPCEIGVKNFKVRYDGYYQDYGRNKYFEAVVQEYLNDFLNQKWADQYPKNTASWTSTIDIPLSDAAYPAEKVQNAADPGEAIEKALKTYGGSLCFTVEVRGEAISMEDYKGVVYGAVHILQQEMDNRPQSMQMYYYRQDPEGDVLQYESTVRTFQFNYNENGIRKATDLHRYVEVTGELETKVNIYYTVKCIFLIVVSGTVVALSVLWCVRKYRKHKRYKKNSGV
ncbi:MAG: hypothetical protein ACLSVG_05230 [Clostridia bacterium]